MFKKLVAPIAVAGALFTLGHSADASEVNFEDLANKAQHNNPELVQQPVHAGAYDYNFTREGINYHFYSDGTHFGYEWNSTLSNNPTQEHLTANHKATTYHKVAQQEQAPTKDVVKRNEGIKTYTTPKVQATSSVRLANGNTPGSIGSKAAQEMAKRTGVPASTWEQIIARESNGDPNAHNPSGADGIFQTIGWGSTATVQDQINSAERAFNSQGLSAWGM